MKETKPVIQTKFHTYYNRGHIDKSLYFDPNSSLTDQDFKMQTDIDYLLAHISGHSRTPIYGVQDNSTFEDWSNEMAMLKRRFMHLDEETRRAFGDAQTFLKWCADPENYKGELPTNLRIKEEKEMSEIIAKQQAEKDKSRAEAIAKAIKGE